MKKLTFIISIIFLANSLSGKSLNLNKEDYKQDNTKTCGVVESLYSYSNCEKYNYKINNPKNTISLYNKALKLNSSKEYLSLGIMHIKGKGVAKNYKKAKLLFKKACDLGSKTGCLNYDLIASKGF